MSGPTAPALGSRSARLDDSGPMVSVVLTTRDRPRFLSVVLECYRTQTYANRELIVVDDGADAPADPEAITAVGGRLLTVETGTVLGTKLNRGLKLARGVFCQKMDDDDWYAPNFLETMVGAALGSWSAYCAPLLAFVTPFLFFDVARWEVRRSVNNNIPGATLFFTRDSWQERPFRNLPGDEDLWFLLDQLSIGANALPVPAVDSFVAVRHGGTGTDRGHTWVHQWDGQPLEHYLLDRELIVGGPESVFQHWALEVYRAVRADILARSS
ncbi:MAG: glycosyltransferase [Chloroflexi bacterium]|nr:glycosyltransferase [Chloroflexota bacterium]